MSSTTIERLTQLPATMRRPPLPGRTLTAISAPRREAAAVIADLLGRHIAPTRSREEQAFIDGQEGQPQ